MSAEGLSKIRYQFSPRFVSWLDRRIPSAGEITLTQRRIFILPTRAGIGFVCLVLGLLIAAINYENNMLFAMSFILLGLFLISILHTHNNLSGLTFRNIGAEPAFCGQKAEYRILMLKKSAQIYQSVRLGWPESTTAVLSLIENTQSRASLFVPTVKRGRQRMGRLKVESRFPLGLMRTWTWLDLEAECIVYPQPISNGAPDGVHSQQSEDGSYADLEGNEEFVGLMDYRPGDSLKQISWAKVARGLPPMSKQFRSPSEQTVWIDWNDYSHGSHEQRLSEMCYQVLRSNEKGFDYGLRLPGVEVQPAHGGAHRAKCLTGLALFDAQQAS